MARPHLIVVSGPPGSGKTTLAHAIARGIPCPAICRDEIKAGLVHADGGGKPAWGGPTSRRTQETFFDVLRMLIGSEVTVVAEAAFLDELWKPDLDPLRDIADIRIVHCVTEPAIARARIARRVTENDPTRASHPDAELLAALDAGTLSLAQFEPISRFGPTIRVDTTNGYVPSLEEVIAFAKAR